MPELSISRRTRATPFTSRLTEAGVKGYTVYNHMLLPTVFRSIEEDYHHLCQHVQVWDVSCERQVQIQGPDANKLVQWMTPRDISQAQDDQCFYLPLCDENGILINDPIAIKVDAQTWWLSIADSDVKLWAKGLALGAGLDVTITEPDVWPVAIQGPKAEELVERLFGNGVRQIRFFRYQRLAFQGHEMIVARSGWSKQGGFEVYVDDPEVGQAMWDMLFERGADLNVGHGGPNLIERIESGLLSFGNDMDYRHTPLQCGLDKYCHLDRDLPSMSLNALRQQKAEGVPRRLIGLAAPQIHQLTDDAKVRLEGSIVGEISSQTLSGKYQAWLGFAMLNSAAIRAVLEENKHLTVHSGNTEYQVICCELPYDFANLNLALRNT